MKSDDRALDLLCQTYALLSRAPFDPIHLQYNRDVTSCLERVRTFLAALPSEGEHE